MIMSNNAIFYYMSKLTTRLDVTSHNTLVIFADQTLASTELCHFTPHLPQPTSKLRLCPILTLSLNSHLIPHCHEWFSWVFQNPTRSRGVIAVVWYTC